MQRFDQGMWSITLPDNWMVEPEGDGIGFKAGDIFYSEELSGELCISTLSTTDGSPATMTDLDDFVDDSDRGKETPVSYGEFAGIAVERTQGQDVYLHAYVFKGNVVLLITYSCDLDQFQQERAIVEGILASLKLKAD